MMHSNDLIKINNQLSRFYWQVGHSMSGDWFARQFAAAISGDQVTSKLELLRVTEKLLEKYPERSLNVRYDAYWIGLGPMYLSGINQIKTWFGYEIDPAMVMVANHTSAEFAINCEFLLGNSLNDPIEEDVYINTSLEHYRVEQLDAMLEQIKTGQCHTVILQITDMPDKDHVTTPNRDIESAVAERLGQGFNVQSSMISLPNNPSCTRWTIFAERT